MLKLKNNIYLKELEKYGFIDVGYKMTYMVENHFGGKLCVINVYTDTRKIEIVDSWSQEIWENTLFDLISNGLVENVGELNNE